MEYQAVSDYLIIRSEDKEKVSEGGIITVGLPTTLEGIVVSAGSYVDSDVVNEGDTVIIMRGTALHEVVQGDAVFYFVKEEHILAKLVDDDE